MKHQKHKDESTAATRAFCGADVKPHQFVEAEAVTCQPCVYVSRLWDKDHPAPVPTPAAEVVGPYEAGPSGITDPDDCDDYAVEGP